MPTLSRPKSLAALLAAGALALGLSACSGDGSSGGGSGSGTGSASSPAAAAGSPSAAPSATPASAPFGTACASVPKDGAGSFADMAEQPVATAASNNPQLSTLVAAVTRAGLVDTLNSAKGVTVIAPTDAAFAKIPKADLDALLADKAELTRVLTYHVVPERLAPAALPGGHTTLEGGKVTVTGSGEDLTVNGTARVLCGNVQTANANVQIVDTVLMPPS
ncbi:hypothetical protein KNE206_51960 [Kitasatospora sp. NE20-6]|uniref:fasciclin domain-containing protein n=1 Tax=Kitasatospora sp. NE20-6 TaxID=2859066 RepID=UPI0034DBB285